MRKDGGARAWSVVAACFLIGFITDGVVYSYGLLFIELLREFKQTKTTSSVIGGIFLGRGLFGPVVSVLINRFGCRAVVVLGATLSFAGFLSSVFSTSVQYLYFSYGCLGGFGFILLVLSKDVAIIQYFEKKRSFAMGISVCGSGIGTIVFGPLAKWLIDEYGWRGTMLLESGLMLNCITCGLVMKPFVSTEEDKWHKGKMVTAVPLITSEDNTENAVCSYRADLKPDIQSKSLKDGYPNIAAMNPKPYEMTTSSVSQYNESPACQEKDRITNYKPMLRLSLLKQKRLIIYLFSGLFRGLGYFTPFTFLPDMVVSKGWSRSQAALLITVIGIVNTVCRVPLGKMADMARVNRTLMTAIGSISIGIISILMPLIEVYEILLFVSVLFGFVVATYVVAYQIIVADLFGEENVTDVFGFVTVAAGLGSFASGPIAGALFDATGDYRVTFATAGVNFIVAGTLTVLLFFMSRGQLTGKTSLQ